ADVLELRDTVRFAGLMPIEKIIALFGEMHMLVTPSKTAADGDME
ncbi:MAG: hypothetical protein HW413_2724, partial [Thermoleophilia bacterium]|nr:hypothetical protein [Thermoleophilia bacterium]